MGAQLEAEGRFPQADYAFENGGLTLELTRLIESKGQQWGSELESSHPILWQDQWHRIDEVATALRHTPPESFRRVQVRCRNGETKEYWAFTKSVRLKRYGRKRIAILHERAPLADTPRCLVTAALQWESGRLIETWRVRWAAPVFHECSKQGVGLEAAQVRTEEAVKRHFRLRGLAQSLLQRPPTIAAASEPFAFAKGEITFGQRCQTITRAVVLSFLSFAQRLFAGGDARDQVAEAVRPA
jgi:hypothetical protein